MIAPCRRLESEDANGPKDAGRVPQVHLDAYAAHGQRPQGLVRVHQGVGGVCRAGYMKVWKGCEEEDMETDEGR